MRMRKKKHGAERINACSELLIQNMTLTAENAANLFGNDHPLWLEIGCGKGAFVCGMAERFPDINFIALERVPDVAMLAMERCKAAELTNVRFIIGDVAKLWDLFPDGIVDRICLNFSDPWPKARHAKRRLTSRQFFERYDKILAYDGVVEFKTDNHDLFEFSLEQVELAGCVLLAKTYDLHNDPTLSRGNIMTEYEEKFAGQGHPIHKLIAMRQ